MADFEIVQSTDRVFLLKGDSEKVLRHLAPDSVDSVVCDPPYGLSKEPDAAEVLRHWLAGDDYQHSGGGFMGRSWDSFVPGPKVWAEVFRVLKPGGHLLSFAGTRTMDLMSMAIRLAGFEIRDTLSWMYGTGFPKSMDVSKAIDKAGGASPVEQSLLLKARREAAGMSREEVAEVVGCTASSVRDWEEGRSRATGMPLEFITPSADYRLALAELLGYSSDERLLIGVSTDRREDGTVFGIGHTGELRSGGNTSQAKQWEGWGTALKPAWEPIIMARKPLIGTVAANVLAHGTGALNIDATRIGVVGESLGGGAETKTTSAQKGNEGWTRPWMENEEQQEAHAARVRDNVAKAESLGRWPANLLFSHHEECVMVGVQTIAGGRPIRVSERRDDLGTDYQSNAFAGRMNDSLQPGSRALGAVDQEEVFDCHEDCPVRMLDEQAGVRKSSGVYQGDGSKRSDGTGSNSFMHGYEKPRPSSMYSDSGAASRFFYRTKAPKSERNLGLPEGVVNNHPTVKPVEVMRWLVRMVTPPGGLVLDPYCGSGTTGVAALTEGFSFAGIDLCGDGPWLEIAGHRMEAVE